MAGSSGIGTYVSALLDRFAHLPELEVLPVRSRSGIYSVREQLSLPVKARGADLFHAPHYNAPLAVPVPLAVTIHDVAHLALPGIFGGVARRTYAQLMLRGALGRARRVITVSAFTRDELVERLGADPARIRVVHNGIDGRYGPDETPEQTSKTLAGLGVDRPFVLYVGNVKPHKNVVGLIRAFEALDDPACELVIAGERDGFRVADPEVGRVVHASPLRDRIRATGRVSDDQLLALYRGARVLAMPSLYEGFGLPLVEAMACGTPVVSSDRASLPEVAGDAALLVDPTDPEGFAHALRRAVEDEDLRARLISAGLRRAQSFRWQDTAAAHVEVYREVSGSRGSDPGA